MKSNRNSIIIIIILLLIITAEAVFIYLDKLNNKEKPTEDVVIESKELVEFKQTQFTETPGQNEYYKILTYTNGDVKIVFKLYTKETNEEIDIKADMFIKDIKYEEVLIDTYLKCDDECPNEKDSFEELKENATQKLRKAVGTIKGDKYYIYVLFDDISNTLNSSLYILNSDSNILENKLQFFGRNEHETYLSCNSDCVMSSYLEDNLGNYAITENALYYFKLSKYEKGEEDKVFANAYKLTISNNKITKEKIGNCEVKVLDLRIDMDLYDFKYEDM